MTTSLVFDENYSIYRSQGSNNTTALAPIGLIPLSGSVHFAEKVNEHLVARRMQYVENNPLLQHQSGFMRGNYRIAADTVRFSSGEAKGVIKSTVRGHDLYIFCDITNHAVTYKMFGKEVPMGPDDYYQDLKRIILATCGRARRINVIMPYLYEGRQNIRNSRESLDCAYMLKELFDLGISSVITFDPHEPRVENAVPRKGLDAVPATYQLISTFLQSCPDVKLSGENGLMVVSPDENGMKRAMYYASVLEIPLGTFFRQRDYSRLVDGRNPVVDLHYLGENVAGRDIVLVDDMLVTGDSFLETALKLKARNARNIYGISTFGMFTSGLQAMNEAYDKGIFDKVFITNMSYQSENLKAAPWLVSCDMTPLIALIIDALNHNVSLSSLLDHTALIKDLLRKREDMAHFDELVK